MVDGVVEVGVLAHRTMAREVLERRGHAGLVHAFDVSAGQRGDDVRILGERAVADRQVAVADIDHRSEAQVDAAATHLLCHQPCMRACRLERGIGVGQVLRAETGQRRQGGVPVLEALHASAFLVHAHQLRARRGVTDRGRKLADLCARGEVALEQDHAGAGIVLQPVALLRGEFGAGYADHEHCELSNIAPDGADRHCRRSHGRDGRPMRACSSSARSSRLPSGRRGGRAMSTRSTALPVTTRIAARMPAESTCRPPNPCVRLSARAQARVVLAG